MRSTHSYVIALIATLVGLALFVYKTTILQFPLLPNQQTESWHIEAKLEFEGLEQPTKVSMFLPRETPGFSIVDENFVSHGYGFSSENDSSDNRIGYWAKRKAEGREVIFYRGILYEAKNASSGEQENPPRPSGLQYTDPAFQSKLKTSPYYMALGGLIEELHAKSADDRSFVAALLNLISVGRDERIIRLREDRSKAGTPAGLMALVLNSAGIPAVVVNGIELEEMRRDTHLVRWVKYYSNNSWHQAVPRLQGEHKPGRLLPWWEGHQPLFTLDGGLHPALSLSVKRHVENQLTEAIWKGDTLSQSIYGLSMFSLPIESQLLFHVLLLIPIGALVTAFMRQLIGVKTFGTFMPVLVALAFRETQLGLGIMWFTVIVGAGLVFRGWFNKLQLLLVPRLSAVLCVVVLLIYLLSLFSFKFGFNSGLSISLFPIVILTMVIERMSVTWEEYGSREAMQRCLGSLFVSMLAYLAMNQEHIAYLVVTFPELLLVVMAASLLLGRYNGYKLMEYRRFRMLKDLQ